MSAPVVVTDANYREVGRENLIASFECCAHFDEDGTRHRVFTREQAEQEARALFPAAFA
jgi:hypothetical protein